MELRKEVLRCYKILLKTCRQVFDGDSQALRLSWQKARQEFASNRHVRDEQEIAQKIKIGWDSIEILKRSVIQAKLNERGNYEFRIKQENID